MSATFSVEDAYDLGMDNKRVVEIEGPSPIPADRRPILYEPIGNMSYKKQMENIPQLKDKLNELMEKHSEKGLVHCTYSLSARLRASFAGNKRIIWHTRDNKNQMLEIWRNSPPSEGKVFMGCGLSEGLDLKGDRGRWQVICKISYPSLGDVAVAAKLKQRPKWYAWIAVRHLIQAAGRICRAEDDRGSTYILDKSFERLYNGNTSLFSQAFKEALIWER
jgi:Rad3-related DNA helicase